MLSLCGSLCLIYVLCVLEAVTNDERLVDPGANNPMVFQAVHQRG